MREDGKEGVILPFAPKKYRNRKPARACGSLCCYDRMEMENLNLTNDDVWR